MQIIKRTIQYVTPPWMRLGVGEEKRRRGRIRKLEGRGGERGGKRL